MSSAKDVKRALGRIRAVLPLEKQVASAYRNIRLGLERIKRAVPAQQSWAGVHVAGTNGKGSVCALLAGMFRLAGISHGCYTSPAMPERHNAVTINGLYVNRRMHDTELRHTEAAYRRAASGWAFAAGEDPGDLTPFELETAAAFRVFERMHVRYGIVEVGMGGATDATNAMGPKAVTVISRIGLDHQEYLGSSLDDIARVKAGIMRRGVPCIVDHSNPPAVLDVLRRHAQDVGTQLTSSAKALPLLDGLDRARFALEDYEQENLLCAAQAFRTLFPHLDLDLDRLLRTRPHLPGRKERVSVSGLTRGARQKPVLVDGAHNLLGAEALAKHVDASLRPHDGGAPVTWVVALSASESKPFSRIIETLLRPRDRLAFVEYAPGPNDPPAAPADLGRAVARDLLGGSAAAARLYDGEPDVASGLRWACDQAGEGPVVVTGSLYLVRELYRLPGVEPQRKIGTRRPGPSQLWYYTQQSQQRRLTPDEEREYKRARRHWHLSPARNPTFRDVRDGGPPQPPPVPERTRQLQRAAALHKRQADGYGAAIASIKKDMEASAAATPPPPSATLLEELRARHAEHIKAYNGAMFKMRGYLADPEAKHMSHEELFGQPERPPRRIAALLRDFDDDDEAPPPPPPPPQQQQQEGQQQQAGTSSREAIEREILQASRDVGAGDGEGGRRGRR